MCGELKSKMILETERLILRPWDEADALNCDFVYAIVPREKFDDIIYKQAQKKAMKILGKVNKNMGLENQLANKDVLEDILKDIVKDLLYKNSKKLWDEQ